MELCVEEAGEGEPVVLVHGIATSRTIWRELIEALGAGVRSVAYDRRAYGDSGAPEPYGGTTVAEQGDDLAALLRVIGGGPAVLCGQGLGALIALDVLVRAPRLARAALLIDTPMLWLSPRGPDAVSATRFAVERGAREGGRGGAVEAYLEDTAGDDAERVLGADRLRSTHESIEAFAADLAAGASWTAGRRELQAVRVPVTLVHASGAGALLGEVTGKLATMLGNARVHELTSGYFAQVEAPAELARLLESLVAATRPGV